MVCLMQQEHFDRIMCVCVCVCVCVVRKRVCVCSSRKQCNANVRLTVIDMSTSDCLGRLSRLLETKGDIGCQ